MFTTAVRSSTTYDVGVPFVSLNALTGHRSCTPEDCSGQVANLPQGPVPVSGVFPAGAIFHLLETGIQAIQLSPYRADLPARHPVRLGMNFRFPGMLFSPVTLSGRVSHQTQRQLLSSLPAVRAIHQRTSWRTDYYGASVAIGLAFRRRSHVRPCLYVLARRRRPTHLLECPRWTSLRTPEVHRSTIRFLCRVRRRFQLSFPADGNLHLLEIELQTIQH